MQMEKEEHKEHIGKLNEKIEHANIENQKVCGGDCLGLWSNFAVFFFSIFCFGFFFATLKLLVIKGQEILMCFSDYFFHLIKQLQTILAEMEEK